MFSVAKAFYRARTDIPTGEEERDPGLRSVRTVGAVHDAPVDTLRAVLPEAAVDPADDVPGHGIGPDDGRVRATAIRDPMEIRTRIT